MSNYITVYIHIVKRLNRERQQGRERDKERDVNVCAG